MRGKFNEEAINSETREMLVNRHSSTAGLVLLYKKVKKKILQWIMVIDGLSSQKNSETIKVKCHYPSTVPSH